MMIINVRKLIEDEAKKRLTKLIDFDDCLEEYKTCGLPNLLQRGSTYTPVHIDAI